MFPRVHCLFLAAAVLAALPVSPAAAADPESDVTALDAITIAAARVGKPATGLPYTVTVITSEELQNQLALGGDIAQLLGNLVPSFSPSRQKMSGFGETLRGREPLILIDGVPQSNPLRNGSRDGYTIDPDMIERIEIIHGANAIQGTGATGGIINFVTKTVDPGQPDETRAAVSFGANDDFDGDSFSKQLHLQHAGSASDFDYLLAAGWQSTGMFFDAEDRAIAVDNTQGDTMDGDGFDLFAKVGYNFGAQRLQFTANAFEFGSDGDWVIVPGDRAAGIPATSNPGMVEGEPAENDVKMYSLDYSHDALDIGEQRGRFHAQLFRQDFAAIYGGGTFGVFAGGDGVPLFDQSRNLSEKTGLKLTYNLPQLIADVVDVTVGFDWLRDTTKQDLVQTGRTWVPETSYVNTAPFAQFNWSIDSVNLTAGVRHESAELDVDDFTTLPAYNSTFVAGGTPDFSETLLNFGANWRVNDNWTVYATHSEGFSMPDVGRVLRGIATPDLDVDSFLNIAPVIADNRELGVQFRAQRGEFRVSYFESDSDLGVRLQPDADGIFSVQRERTEISGIEVSAAFDISLDSSIGANYASIEGRYDNDGDGAVDSDLSGVNVAPDRANIFWQQNWTDFLDTRLQANYLFDREFETLGVLSGEFEGYTTLDLVVNWLVNDDNRIQLGIENLLDEQYITYYSQTVVDLRDPLPATSDDYFAGRGRNIYVTWRTSF